MSVEAGLRSTGRRAHPSHDKMPESHLGRFEVEEIEKLGCLACSQSVEVDAFRLVVHLELDRQDLDSF